MKGHCMPEWVKTENVSSQEIYERFIEQRQRLLLDEIARLTGLTSSKMTSNTRP